MGGYQGHALNLTSEVTGTSGATDRDYSKHVQKRVGIYLSPPRDTMWILTEPELASPTPLSAVGGSAQSPQPRVFQPRRGYPGPNSKVPFLSRAGPGEGLLQAGEGESQGCEARPWLGQKVTSEKPAVPPTGQPSGEQVGGGGTGEWVAWWRGGQGLQFFPEEASRGPSGRRGRGQPPGLRRRTPPAWWASGRRRHWPASAPPGSSCLRPSSSSGTA